MKSTQNPVIDFMPDQRNIELMGGTMRLGAYDCKRRTGFPCRSGRMVPSRSAERHRHRYEFNNRYKADLRRARHDLLGAPS